MSKIVIGTANFGSNYGYKKNKVKKGEIKKIINYIKQAKYKFIDTANFYGNAQKILGKNIKFKVNYISKIKINKQDITNTSNLVKKVNLILNELKVKKIYALLIHNPQLLKLDKEKKIYKSLINMKKKCKIK